MEMKNRMKTKWLLMMCIAFVTTLTMAQDVENNFDFSLDEAQEYALMNNLTIKTSKLSIEAAKMSTWEAISAGLPKLDGSASFNDNLKIMTTLMPGDFFGQPGTYVPVQFGQQFNTSYGVQASTLLFNASYFVGIQTAKLAESLSSESLEKSEIDIKSTVASTYYLILISAESIRILDENKKVLEETLGSTRAMYEVGMAEQTDVDQMGSTVSMVDNTKKSMERNLELNYNLLRFQLGLQPETELTLTQTLEDFLEEISITTINSQDFNLKGNIDYRLLTSQEKMSELSVKMSKSEVLPTLSAFYTYTESGMGNELSDLSWFPSSMVGFQFSVPIFASGQRYSKIKRTQIELEKTRTNKALISDQLYMQEKQLRYNLINSNEQFLSQKDNVELAKRVYNSVQNKYNQGVASSLDLSQANGNYLDAENNYISSLMNLLTTKLSLDKLLNNL
jgi:outer membrane protein